MRSPLEKLDSILMSSILVSPNHLAERQADTPKRVSIFGLWRVFEAHFLSHTRLPSGAVDLWKKKQARK